MDSKRGWMPTAGEWWASSPLSLLVFFLKRRWTVRTKYKLLVFVKVLPWTNMTNKSIMINVQEWKMCLSFHPLSLLPSPPLVPILTTARAARVVVTFFRWCYSGCGHRAAHGHALFVTLFQSREQFSIHLLLSLLELLLGKSNNFIRDLLAAITFLIHFFLHTGNRTKKLSHSSFNLSLFVGYWDKWSNTQNVWPFLFLSFPFWPFILHVQI